MKKLVVALILVMLAGCNTEAFAIERDDRKVVAEEEKVDFKIGVAVGQANALDDNTFNAIAWQGVVQYIQRYPWVKVQRSVPRKTEDEEMKQVVDELLTIGCDVILGFGEEYAKIFEQTLSDNPEVAFILFSGGRIESEGENFVAIDFQDQQSAFLGGVAAALNTDSGKVGFLGGKPDESVTRQSLGFKAGIGYANANYGAQATLEEPVFADSFDDVVKGRQLAKKMYEDDVDVIFACARVTGKGAMEAAEVMMEQGRDVWLIGVDNDLYSDGIAIDDKSVVLTSIVKKMDIVVYEILEDFARDRFPGGQYILRELSDQSLGLPDKNRNFDEKTKVLVGRTEDMILDGSLVIPFDLEELEVFADSFN